MTSLDVAFTHLTKMLDMKNKTTKNDRIVGFFGVVVIKNISIVILFSLVILIFTFFWLGYFRNHL